MFQHNQVCSRQDIPYFCFRLLKIRLIRGVLYKKNDFRLRYVVIDNMV